MHVLLLCVSLFLSKSFFYFVSYFLCAIYLYIFLTIQLFRDRLIRATLRLVALTVNVVRLMAMRFVHVSICALVHHLIVELSVLLVRTVGQIKRV